MDNKSTNLDNMTTHPCNECDVREAMIKGLRTMLRQRITCIDCKLWAGCKISVRPIMNCCKDFMYTPEVARLLGLDGAGNDG